ncbi:trypsin-like peptidase domain-containing protein [Alkalicella caledoniensis]|uniref:Trypsin-like peptidase domain-containing protein n=1 Tax=Alkalicella caledoniensis TaxID=2731377 RepID=A0A7G9W8N1_ALKCA|nr:trypsin-like peptidase domain-containing protein [Alkalicella caledoniensis]QNO15043.1 trypsin-like peptidase domain-containing protein [Alkalicella caledoniensis]
MDYFEYYYKPKRPSLSLIIVIALISSIIGGAIALTFFAPQQQTLPPTSNGDLIPPARDTDEDFQWEALEYQKTPVVQAVQKVSPAVVGISTFANRRDMFRGTEQMVQRGVGSGVIIESNGYIVTNYHVIEEGEIFVVTLDSGEEIEAEVIGSDPGTDLAVLKIDKTGLPSAELGDSDKLVVGETAIAIGNPTGLDLQQSVAVGVVSATDRSLEIYEWIFSLIQTDAAINPGNSGGPLVNAVGQVVGINSVKISNAEGLGFAIPSNIVRNVVNEIIRSGEVTRPMIGIVINEINQTLARQYDLPVDHGLYIVEVADNSPAHLGGIQSNDIITHADGKEINSLRDFRMIMVRKQAGQSVEITVVRGDETLEFTITLADMNN